jgi:hypothetical protein
MLKFSNNPRGSHYADRYEAEHAIETGSPPTGYFYEVVEVRCPVSPPVFAVRAYEKDGAFTGYWHHAAR